MTGERSEVTETGIGMFDSRLGSSRSGIVHWRNALLVGLASHLAIVMATEHGESANVVRIGSPGIGVL